MILSALLLIKIHQNLHNQRDQSETIIPPQSYPTLIPLLPLDKPFIAIATIDLLLSLNGKRIKLPFEFAWCYDTLNDLLMHVNHSVRSLLEYFKNSSLANLEENIVLPVSESSRKHPLED